MNNIQYGFIIEVYSYIAIFLVVLTYGFETSFFRYSKDNPLKNVFTTSLTSIVSTSILFLIVFYLFISNYDLRDSNPIFNQLLFLGGVIASIDAVTSIVFAKLRLEGRSLKFGFLKIINISILLCFNILLLFVCPIIIKNYQEYNYLILWFYKPGNEAVYVLVSNLISSLFVLFILLPDIFKSFGKFDAHILKSMYKYSFPILIVGISGMININIDKTLIPHLIGGEKGYEMLAIYGANYKIGVLMAMFTQSFRLAFEPFFFKNHSEVKKTDMYSKILLYFILFGFLIFLAVTFFMGIINLLLTKSYIVGNVVIPYVLIAQLLSGIYFTLSVWYKVSDKTIYGAYMGIFGSILTLIGNFVLIPYLGYLGSAISGVICFGSMVLLSIYLGNKHYYIRYNWRLILSYTLITLIVYLIGIYGLPWLLNYIVDKGTKFNIVSLYVLRIGLIIVFLGFVYNKEYKKLKVFQNVS